MTGFTLFRSDGVVESSTEWPAFAAFRPPGEVSPQLACESARAEADATGAVRFTWFNRSTVADARGLRQSAVDVQSANLHLCQRECRSTYSKGGRWNLAFLHVEPRAFESIDPPIEPIEGIRCDNARTVLH